MNDATPKPQHLCKRVRPALAAFAAGDLDPARRAACEAHLAGCAACARALDELRASLVALRSAGEVEPPPRAMEQVLWRIASLPAPARPRRWLPLAGLSTAAAVLVVGVVLTIVTLNRQPLPIPMPAAERKAALGEAAPAAPPSPGLSLKSAKPLGGLPSSGHDLASARSAAGPAQRHAPLPPSSPSAVAPVPAERRGRPARPSPAVALAPRPGPSGPAATAPAEEKAAAPALAAPMADMAAPEPAGRGGAAVGLAGAGAPAAPAPEPRAHVLGGGGAREALRPDVYTVSEKYWVIRVEAPRPVYAGKPAAFGLLFDGRESLTAVRAVVLGPSGRALGRPIDIALIPAGGQVQASVPFMVPRAGHVEVAVSVEADRPVLHTRIPIPLDVESPPGPPPPIISLALRDVPLHRALTAMAHQTGVKITVADSLADLTVDADFADPIPLEAALRLLAEQVGGTLECAPDGSYKVMEVR